ncbi:MAG: MarR family transcriptional regulator [Pseudomonadales bacterium]
MRDRSNSPSQPGSDPDRNVTVVFTDVYLRLRRYFNQQTREFGLTSTQWHVLRCLSVNDGMTQTEIAELLDMGKSPLGKKIDALEAAGWVARQTDAKDRRAKRVYLTEKVDQYRERLIQVTEDCTAAVISGIDEQDAERLVDMLLVMRANLDRAIGIDPPS